MRRRALAAGFAAVCVLPALGLPARAQVPEGDPADLPVLSAQTLRGTGTLTETSGTAPTAKTIDGDIGDWVGRATGYGGTVAYSAGELVYQDHIFDAYGPDDGRDTARFELTDPLEEHVDGAYRVDALSQADAAGELGIPAPEQFSYNDSYGDAVNHQDNADLVEVRIARGSAGIDLLARTTTMKDSRTTALLVLADTAEGETVREVGFNSGLTTSVADVAFFLADGVALQADLASGETSPLGTAVADHSGWNNAIEASLPIGGVSSVAIASGTANAERTGFEHLTIETAADADPHANVANVAFRTAEPVRMWFEKQQALSLNQGTIDPFFLEVDWSLIDSGVAQTYEPGHGYHDRIFLSDPATGVPEERGRDGIFQHYGVYLPEAYTGAPLPLQWWLHWRGGHAHSGAAVVPKVFKQFGEDRDTIVVAPSGRGTSTWYVGKGHVDVLQVWADVFDTFAIDRSRVYASGHSMGGWGSYLLTLLYPDRFAAAAPAAGPVTMGAWTGADFEGCDEMRFDEYTPCYISANGSDPRAQHTRKLLENSLHVPYAILHGTSDELVPVSGVLRQHERLMELGYRHRMYTYPGYEHYSHPAVDQWAEAASYLHRFTRPANPSRVVYKRDMPFEEATESVQSGGVDLNFDFDSAYWMSELTPGGGSATASFDGTSHAIPDTEHLTAPDTGAPTAPGQTGPYVITGLQWIDDPLSDPTTANAFDVTLTGAERVRLDLARMDLSTSDPIAGAVNTELPLSLRLDGGWSRAPEVLLDGAPATTTLAEGVLTIEVPAGAHSVTITPSDDPVETATTVQFTETSATSAQYSDTATLVARLTTAEGAPLAGRSLTFGLGSTSASAQTDEGGRATVSLPVTDTPGATTATVGFDGADGYLPAVASTPFTIARENTLTDLQIDGKGSKRRLTATLVDADSGAGVGSRTIVFTVDGETIGTATTDDLGVAVFHLPARYGGGNRTFGAVFEGDAFYEASSG